MLRCAMSLLAKNVHPKRAVDLPAMQLSFLTYTGGIAETNGYFLPSPDGGILIDAPEGVCDWLAAQGLRPSHLLLTHQHFDHVMDAAALQARGTKICAFADYDSALTLEHVTRSWGMPDVKAFVVDELLDPQNAFTMAGRSFELAHVPGHAPDSLTFFDAEHGWLFSGDTLFQQSIGRTDIPNHGNHAQLLHGIKKHLLSLPGDTKVFPGHGPSTTIAHEARSNPYLR